MAQVNVVKCEKTSGITKSKVDISDYLVYRPKKNASGVVKAALLFVAYAKNYTYSSSNAFKGKKVTDKLITDTYKSKQNMSGIGLCRNCISYAFGDKSITLSYETLAGNEGKKTLTYVGKATGVKLQQGDILGASLTSNSKGKTCIYVGSAKLSEKDKKKATQKYEPRLQYPSLDNKYYFDKNYNTYVGGPYSPPNTYANCPWYAYGRISELTQTKHPEGMPTHGNGYDVVPNSTYPKGKTPKQGALIGWGPESGKYGSGNHIAVVEYVWDNGDILTSNSGYQGHYGPPSNKILNYKGKIQKSSDWTVTPYFYLEYLKKSNNYDGCQGFAYPTGIVGGSVDSNGDVIDTRDETGITAIDMQKRTATLYSSDNYKYIDTKEEEEDEVPSLISTLVSSFKNSVQALNKQNIYKGVSGDPLNVSKYISEFIVQAVTNVSEKISRQLSLNRKPLSVASTLVEAPFAEIQFSNGMTIGSINGSTDYYPNYMSSISVDKVNGVINQYKINLAYQIRAGEDPNLIDELLSANRYDKITLRYGDANTGNIFNDSNLIITNVGMSRDYASARISYTIEATSAGDFVKTYTTNFPAVVDKPSNVIRDLLYNNSETSSILLSAFDGMIDKTLIESKGLIPTNDSVVDIDEQKNTDLISYINYLVGCMSNQTQANKDIRNSLYYIYYMDTINNNFNGSYFQIHEVVNNVNPYGLTNVIYEVDIGYPDDNFVMDFSVSNDLCWSVLYENSSPSSEYVYSVLNNGNVKKSYSLNLVSSSNVLNEINKNWWTDMTTFPVSATLTLKGLLKPVMLTSYIKVNTQFYGQPHISSGLYTVIGQHDELTSAGFRTTLSLVRVSNG